MFDSRRGHQLHTTRRCLRLKTQLQRELHRPWGTQSKHAGTQAQAIAAGLRAGKAVRSSRAVDRSAKSIQGSTQRVRWSVKVRQVHHVEERHSRLHFKFFPEFVNPVQADVESPKPSHTGLVVRGRCYGLLYAAQGLQLRESEQIVGDQRLPGRSGLTGKVVVVVGNHIVDVAAAVGVVGINAMPERADVGTRQHISTGTIRSKTAVACTIPGNIGYKDAARVSGGAQV